MLYLLSLMYIFFSLLHADIYEPDSDQIEIECIQSNESNDLLNCKKVCAEVCIENDSVVKEKNCTEEEKAAIEIEKKDVTIDTNVQTEKTAVDTAIEEVCIEQKNSQTEVASPAQTNTNTPKEDVEIVIEEDTSNTNKKPEALIVATSEVQQNDVVQKIEVVEPASTTPASPPPTLPKKRRTKKGAVNPVISKDETRKSSRSVTVTNAINQENITYKHWSGTYTPEFYVFVNDTELAGGTNSVVIENNEVTVSYRAKFPYGYSSKDSYTTEISDSAESVSIDFDWKRKPRIEIIEK